MKRTFNLFSFVNLVGWGMSCGFTAAFYVLWTNHLSVDTQLLFTGCIVKFALSATGLILALSLGARLIKRTRQFGEGLEFFAGLAVWLNWVGIVSAWLVGHTNLGPSWWVWWVALALLNAALIGAGVFVLLRGKQNTETLSEGSGKNSPANPEGWTVHSGLIPITLGVILYLARSQIFQHGLTFGYKDVLPHVTILGAIIVFVQACKRRPRLIGWSALALWLTLGGCHLWLRAGEWLHARQSLIAHAKTGIHKVILITVDTLRYDMVFGDRPDGQPLAPNLRKLAGEGLMFPNAISAAPWTFPSFASMMTGLEPLVHNLGRRADQKVMAILPDSIPMLSERFQWEGRLTSAFVYNHFLDRSLQWNRGFDEYFFADAESVEAAMTDMLHQVIGPDARYSTGRDSTMEITQRASSWIRKRQENRYFIWLHYLDPHLPYDPPGTYLPKDIDKSRGEIFDVTQSDWVHKKFPEDERRWIRQLYEAEVRYVDENIGKIIEVLRETGQYDDALIIFTSDHGEEFWDHGQYEHGHSLHAELLHVPFVVKLPAPAKPAVFDRFVATPQLMATITDLCGLETEDVQIDYPSLRPVWEDGTTTEGLMRGIWSGGLLYGPEQEAYTVGALKLIHKISEDGFELYDLSADPGEQHDLAEERAEELEMLKTALASHREEGLRKRTELGLDVNIKAETAPGVVKGLKRLGYM